MTPGDRKPGKPGAATTRGPAREPLPRSARPLRRARGDRRTLGAERGGDARHAGAGRGHAVETPIGWLPTPADIPTEGLAVSAADLAELLRVDADEWQAEVPLIAEYFDSLGTRLPGALRDQLSEHLTVDHHALHAAAVGIDDARLHRVVGRLQHASFRARAPSPLAFAGERPKRV